MKNFSKIGSILLCFLLLAVMLCGCGEVAKGTEYGNTDFSYYASTADSDSAPAEAGKTKSVAENRKIIEYYYFTIETKTFDALLKQIEETVSNSGGYIESSEIDGSGYEYRTENRNATLKIRIPKTKQTDFSEFLDANANVVSRSVNTEDVTEQYIDTESRIKALTLEKETLEKLLTKSAGLSDTLAVYDKLTNVIAEIESYQGKLNQMDQLIDYTTFTVCVKEVERETMVDEQNWFAKTWNDFTTNLSDVGNGLLDFASFVLAALPYWILIALVVAVMIFIVRRAKKRKAQKHLAKQAETSEKTKA